MMTEQEALQQLVKTCAELGRIESDPTRKAAFGLLGPVVKRQQDAIVSLQVRVKKLEDAAKGKST